jgi:hypothetical protein
MLMASVPRLDRRWEEVKQGLGSTGMPSEMAGASADSASVGREPELVEVEPDHLVAMAD